MRCGQRYWCDKARAVVVVIVGIAAAVRRDNCGRQRNGAQESVIGQLEHLWRAWLLVLLRIHQGYHRLMRRRCPLLVRPLHCACPHGQTVHLLTGIGGHLLLAPQRLRLQLLCLTWWLRRLHLLHLRLLQLCLLLLLWQRRRLSAVGGMALPVHLLAGIVTVRGVPAAIELRLPHAIRTPLLLLGLLHGAHPLQRAVLPQFADHSLVLLLHCFAHLADHQFRRALHVRQLSLVVLLDTLVLQRQSGNARLQHARLTPCQIA